MTRLMCTFENKVARCAEVVVDGTANGRVTFPETQSKKNWRYGRRACENVRKSDLGSWGA